MRNLALKLFGSISVLGAMSFPAQANLIQNGSFEDPAVLSGSFITVNPGQSVIPNWTVSAIGNAASGSVDLVGTYWTASNGFNSVDLYGTPNNTDNTGTDQSGMITQTFGTVAGQMYRVSFDLAGNPDGGPTIKTLGVNVLGPGDTNLYSNAFTFDTTGKTRDSMGWINKVFQFQAIGPTTMLKFFGDVTPGYTGGKYWGPVIDNVQADPVPVPGAVWLLGSGALGLMKYWRRKQRM